VLRRLGSLIFDMHLLSCAMAASVFIFLINSLVICMDGFRKNFAGSANRTV